jgi:hypothetical protein
MWTRHTRWGASRGVQKQVKTGTPAVRDDESDKKKERGRNGRSERTSSNHQMIQSSMSPSDREA